MSSDDTSDVLEVPEDWAFHAFHPSLLAEVLRDESIVAVLVLSVLVLKQGEGQILAVLSLVKGSLVDFRDVDIECDHA